MYRPVVLALYAGGRGRTAGALTTSRYTDPILKCFSLGSVHSCEKKPPETQISSDTATEAKPLEQHVSSHSVAEANLPEQHVISDPATEAKLSEKQVSSDPATEAKLSEKQVSSDPATEAKPPGKHVSSDPAEEGKIDKLHKNRSPQPPAMDTLLNVLKGMKVQVSAKDRFKAKKIIPKEQMKKMEEMQSSSKMFQMAREERQPMTDDEVGPKIKAAVSAVASTFPDKKNQVESELLQQLRIHKQVSETQRKGGVNISEVLSGMQVVPRKKLDEQHPDQDKARSWGKLFTGKRLRMFPVPPVSKPTTMTESSLTLWDIELAKEIAFACEQPPRNGFEEMIQWTNEGKLWTFPINNEAGMVEEQNVEFYEHIFLDKYLNDFPKEGPIRHFMELVVCGLSKNPYLTVQQKKEHIEWFRDYFNQKEDILRECELLN